MHAPGYPSGAVGTQLRAELVCVSGRLATSSNGVINDGEAEALVVDINAVRE